MGDLPDLMPLASNASTMTFFDEARAGAGYDGTATHRFSRETLGVPSLAKKRGSLKIIGTMPCRQEMRRLSNSLGRRQQAGLPAVQEGRNRHVGCGAEGGEALSAHIDLAQRLRPHCQLPCSAWHLCLGLSTKQGVLSSAGLPPPSRGGRGVAQVAVHPV